MPATWNSDQLNTVYSFLGPSAVAGVAGGAQQVRGVEFRGIPKIRRFTVECATPNPTPGNAAGSFANGDLLFLTEMRVIERIWSGKVYIGVGWGAGVTLAFGKLDRNNSANTDGPHYLAPISAANPGSADFNTNMTEQVGATPIGDLTTGQQIPQFGSDWIILTSTIGGGTPNATGTLIGWIMTTEEGN